MLSIKEFNKKITSLKNTRKMTKTMKMVSASKFKRAYKAQNLALSYAHKLQGLMGRLTQGQGVPEHPLCVVRRDVKNVLILVLSADKGLCGGFNNNLIRFVRQWLNQEGKSFAKVDMSYVGKKSYNAFRRLKEPVQYYEGVAAKPSFEQALSISKDLVQAYLSKQYDQVWIAYNEFKGPMLQIPRMELLLPLDPKQLVPVNSQQVSVEYEFEPASTEMFPLMVNKYINFKLYFSLLENSAGEHGARMTAMDKATQNTADLIDRYTLLRNRARQAAITTELIEIIAGAEALK